MKKRSSDRFFVYRDSLINSAIAVYFLEQEALA